MKRRIISYALTFFFPTALLAASPAAPDYLHLLLHRRAAAPMLVPAGAANDPDAIATDQPEKALQWIALTLRDSNKKIPVGALYAANLHRRDLLHRKAHGIGPIETTSLVEGSFTTINRSNWAFHGAGNLGGRTRSILLLNDSSLYAGATGGGVWKTANLGGFWTHLKDFMGNLVISSMVFDPSTTSTIYAATGEVLYAQIGDGWDGDAVNGLHGAGIFKSTDSGTTWNQLTNTAGWAAVSRLATTSVSGTTYLLAATTDGIYRSTDGSGTSWTLVYSAAAGAEMVAFDPNNSQNAVASVILWNGTTWYHQPLYSTNAGATWTAATGAAFASGFSNRIEMAYAISASGTVYANVAMPFGGASGELWKSTDGGQTFTRVSAQGATDCNFGHCAIWVSPTDATLVVVGGVSLARSTNSGASFTNISGGYINTDDPHPDQHCILSVPGYGSFDKTVFVCNDGGVFYTPDITTAAANAGSWTSINRGYNTTQFYGATGNAANGEIYTGGTQDNGNLFTTLASWDADYWVGGDGGWVAIDFQTPSNVYGEYIYLQVERTTNAFSQGSGTFIDSGLTDAGTNANFIAPLVMDPLIPTTLLGGGSSLWRTTTATAGSPAWTAIRGPGSAVISAIAVWRYSSDVIWVAQNDGVIQKTSNGTASFPTWTTVTGPMSSRYITRMYIDPADSQTVYLAYGGYHTNNLWKTTNGGTTWSQITGTGLNTLPAAPIRGLVRHPRDSRIIYVGTDVGIFESDDGGTNWTTTDEGPADVAVDELQFVEGGNDELLAGTYGRGMWSIDLSGVASYSPAGLVASATSTTSVHASWNTYTGATSYQLFRSSGGGAYVQIATPTTTSFDDTGLTPGTTYLYKVKAVVSGTPTDLSAPDLATTVLFTNDNALSGRTIAAPYLTEMRNAVNDVLVAAGYPTQSYSGGTSGSFIAASDINDLRSALTKAYRKIGMPAPTYAQAVANGVLIKASHYQEIRNYTK